MEQAKAKQEEAMQKDREAEDLEKMAVETERNVLRLCESGKQWEAEGHGGKR